MSLESVTAFASVATVLIVAATAIAALVQLRHLSAANQINAMLSTGQEINDEAFHNAATLVRQRLGGAMQDPVFRDYLVAYNRGQRSRDVGPEYLNLHRAALLLGNRFEEFGLLIKSNVVRRELFLDVFAWIVLREWRQLSELNSFARAASGNGRIWDNFEYLAVLAEDWLNGHASVYPRGMRRMPDSNRWPIATEGKADDTATGEPTPRG